MVVFMESLCTEPFNFVNICSTFHSYKLPRTSTTPAPASGLRSNDKNDRTFLSRMTDFTLRVERGIPSTLVVLD